MHSHTMAERQKLKLFERAHCPHVMDVCFGEETLALIVLPICSAYSYIMITHHSAYARIYRRHWIAAMILFCWLLSYGMQLPTLFQVWGKFWRCGDKWRNFVLGG